MMYGDVINAVANIVSKVEEQEVELQKLVLRKKDGGYDWNVEVNRDGFTQEVSGEVNE